MHLCHDTCLILIMWWPGNTWPPSRGFYLSCLIFPVQLETRIGYRTSKEIDWWYFGVTGAKFGGWDNFWGSNFLKILYFDFSNKNNILKKIGWLWLSGTVLSLPSHWSRSAAFWEGHSAPLSLNMRKGLGGLLYCLDKLSNKILSGNVISPFSRRTFEWMHNLLMCVRNGNTGPSHRCPTPLIIVA